MDRKKQGPPLKEPVEGRFLGEDMIYFRAAAF